MLSLPIEVQRELVSRPESLLVEMDRMIIAKGGLRAFIELAWHAVEPEGRFVGGWHIDAICAHLEAVARGENLRLMVAVPPRCMKTLICSVFFPAWVWITQPEKRFLFVSYAQALSLEASLKCRRVIQSPWYQKLYGHVFKLLGDANAKEKFDNDKSGYRMATSVDAMITGFGGDLVIIDDPLNAKSASSELDRTNMLRWWTESMPTRLNDQKTGAFVIIQQRLHAEDLIGEILRSAAKRWVYLCLPMRYEPDHPNVWPHDPRTEMGELLWPAHVPEYAVASLEDILKAYGTAGQLQQRPAPREGGIFKRSWFPITHTIPADVINWSRAWDLASTVRSQMRSDPDWTATCLIGFSPSRKKWIIKEVARWRESSGEVRRLIHSHAVADGYGIRQTVPKDPGQAGKDQAQSLALMLAGWNVTLETPTGDKGVRATPLASQAEAGNVELMAGDWNEDFLTEIASFPTGAHDDMLDAAASAFNRISDGTTGILDWYRQRVDDEERQRLAEALARANAKAQPAPMGEAAPEANAPEHWSRLLAQKPP